MVFSSSKLGEALVGKAYAQMTHYDVEVLIQTLLEGEVSATLVDKSMQEFLASVKAMGKGPFAALNPAKEIKVVFGGGGGVEFSVPYSCVIAMWLVAKDAALRIAVVGWGSLPALWGENDLACNNARALRRWFGRRRPTRPPQDPDAHLVRRRDGPDGGRLCLRSERARRGSSLSDKSARRKRGAIEVADRVSKSIKKAWASFPPNWVDGDCYSLAQSGERKTHLNARRQDARRVHCGRL